MLIIWKRQKKNYKLSEKNRQIQKNFTGYGVPLACFKYIYTDSVAIKTMKRHLQEIFWDRGSNTCFLLTGVSKFNEECRGRHLFIILPIWLKVSEADRHVYCTLTAFTRIDKVRPVSEEMELDEEEKW